MAHIDSLFVNSVLVLALLQIGGTLLANIRRRGKRVAAMVYDRKRPLDQRDLT